MRFLRGVAGILVFIGIGSMILPLFGRQFGFLGMTEGGSYSGVHLIFAGILVGAGLLILFATRNK